MQNNFVRSYCDSYHISMHLKKVSKWVHFCAAILILKMEENTQHFWRIKLYYFKKGKNTKKKICAEYGECAMTDKIC